jgi:hypothetical protein
LIILTPLLSRLTQLRTTAPGAAVHKIKHFSFSREAALDALFGEALLGVRAAVGGTPSGRTRLNIGGRNESKGA